MDKNELPNQLLCFGGEAREIVWFENQKTE